MSRTVKHNHTTNQFEIVEDGISSFIDYELQDNTLTITHTRVPEAVGGRGIAADLTKHALFTARNNGWKVVPQCSYVAAYIKRHPEYQDLLA